MLIMAGRPARRSRNGGGQAGRRSEAIQRHPVDPGGSELAWEFGW